MNNKRFKDPVVWGNQIYDTLTSKLDTGGTGDIQRKKISSARSMNVRNPVIVRNPTTLPYLYDAKQKHGNLHFTFINNYNDLRLH